MHKSLLQLHRQSSKQEPAILDNFGVPKSVKIEKGFKKFFSEDEVLAYLAKVLVEAYFKQNRYERTKQP